MKIHLIKIKIKVSTHSRPKAAGARVGLQCFQSSVSTHSRPKAAGTVFKIFAFCEHGFNTQPPEGGWCSDCSAHLVYWEFQHTAARRRLVMKSATHKSPYKVSTHSRPKAAGGCTAH